MSGFDFSTNHSQAPNGMLPLGRRNAFADFEVKFWGVRGNVPTPGAETVRYGGNTACVEIQVGHQRLIFDGGTGLRVLGKQLCHEMPIQAHLFFTHTHWDRIQGFPFFEPAFIEGNRFDIYGAVGANGASIKQRLSDQMLRPNFPVPLQAMRSHLQFHDIAPGSVINLGEVMVETISLNRPNGALGYRITHDGRSVVYATDTEHAPGQLDQALCYLSNQADLLIYDAACLDPTYCTNRKVSLNQPPTSWHNGIEVAIAAQVKQVVLFHHDPTHDDDFLDQVEFEVRSTFSQVQLAREGMTIQVAAANVSVP